MIVDSKTTYYRKRWKFGGILVWWIAFRSRLAEERLANLLYSQ